MREELTNELKKQLEISRRTSKIREHLLNKINDWLVNEITTYQKIEKRINDGEYWEDVCDDVEAFRHRKENAERLFNLIDQWEKETS
tara:strand:- start:74 stop:334 length:261 start_codon:yes stop_codon:yes gene_type:complete